MPRSNGQDERAAAASGIRRVADLPLPRVPDSPRHRRPAATPRSSGNCAIDDVRSHSDALTPDGCVGAEDVADDDEPFDVKSPRLLKQLEEQFAESARLEALIRRNRDEPRPGR